MCRQCTDSSPAAVAPPPTAESGGAKTVPQRAAQPWIWRLFANRTPTYRTGCSVASSGEHTSPNLPVIAWPQPTQSPQPTAQHSTQRSTRHRTPHHTAHHAHVPHDIPGIAPYMAPGLLPEDTPPPPHTALSHQAPRRHARRVHYTLKGH